MSALNKLTSKGQVTIPSTVRRGLGVKPGDSVEFFKVDGAYVVRKAEPPIADVDAIFDALLGTADRRKDLTTDEILDEIRPWRLDPI